MGRDVVLVTDWVCPEDWCGMTRGLEDGRVVFACGGCRNPEDCANNRSCERDERGDDE